MDIHCKESNKLPTIIRSGLRLKFPSKVNDHDFYKTKDGEDNLYTLNICNKGLITSKTVKEYLQEMVKSGDPLMVIELYQAEVNIAHIPTKPSKILECFSCQNEDDNMNHKKSLLYHGAVPEGFVPKPQNTYFVLRWLTCPLLFVAFAWVRLLYPDVITNHYKEMIFNQAWLAKKNVVKMLPILPKNLMEAYLMGTYVKGYQMAEISSDY